MDVLCLGIILTLALATWALAKLCEFLGDR